MKEKIIGKTRIGQEDLVSIIIPLYNNQKYIGKCVQSLQNQTYQNIEIIVVDNCSTDESLAVVNAIAEKDQRVKVFSEDHKGVSCARNKGIKNAVGDYLCFVDSDDYVSKTFVESLLSVIKHTGADVSAVQFTRVGQKQRQKFKKTFNYQNYKVEEYDTISAMNQLFCGKRVRMNIWNKMYPRSFFDGEDGLLYDETLKHCEDVYFLYQAFLRCKKVAYLPIKSYAYTVRSGSLVHSKVDPNKLTSLTAVRRCADRCAVELPQALVQVAGWQALVNIEMFFYMFRDGYFDYQVYKDVLQTFKEKMKYVPKGKLHYWHRRYLGPVGAWLLKVAYTLRFRKKIKAEKQKELVLEQSA